jgi:hypothetical protein
VEEMDSSDIRWDVASPFSHSESAYE